MFDGFKSRWITLIWCAASTASQICRKICRRIPLGRYQISVTSNGKPLKMKLNKPRGTAFGMTPNETNGTAKIVFAPGGAQAKMVSPQAGGWDSVEISVER
ncbi:MAG: hypothetical protein ACR2IA_02815 [Pyrinomonadaceae bacterium]